MEMPANLILAVIKKASSYNSWWYVIIPAATFEREENGFAGSLKNVEAYYSGKNHGTEVHAFKLIKEDEYVEEGLSSCDCETYALRGIYQTQVNDITENVVLELHEDMDGNTGYDVVYELDDFPTLAGEDEVFDLNSI